MIDNQLNQTPFPEVFANAIPYMEADGARWYDTIYAIRAMHGLDTDSRYLRIENDNVFGWTDILPHIPTVDEVNQYLDKDLEQRDYTSDTLFRRMIFKDTIPYLVVTIGLSRNDVVIVSAGESHFTQMLKTDLEQALQKPATINLRRMVGWTDSGPAITTDILTNEQLEDYSGHPEFYPFMEPYGGMNQLFDDFRNARETLILFIGEPGTGKTVALNSLLRRMEADTATMILGENTISHPGLPMWLHGCSGDQLLMFEDADNLCRSRENGNSSMSSILTHTTHVASAGTKIAISTNLKTLKDVDEALIRPGRVFKIIHFRKLTPEEANKARAVLNRPPVEFGRDVTLSEALNWEQVESLMKATKVGFGG